MSATFFFLVGGGAPIHTDLKIEYEKAELLSILLAIGSRGKENLDEKREIDAMLLVQE
jgi:hypothetical protein